MDNFVSISKTEGYGDISSGMSSSIEEVGGMKLSDGDKVLIKINICGFRAPSSGAITHPLFLSALLSYLRTNFKDLDITVIESDATSSRPDITLSWFGFDKILKKWNVKWYNLSKNAKRTVQINGFYFNEIEISEIFSDHDYFITAPKLKSHSLTKITASLKNQFGCIPYKRKVKFHKNLDEIIADANLAMKADFCLVDGIISMCGGGATYGIPKKTDIIIAGKNPVSVDAVCAKIFGYAPRRIGHIQKAKKLGLGTDRYELVGETLELDTVRINNEYPFWKEYALDFGRYLRDLKVKT